MEELIPTESLKPLHGVRNHGLLKELVANMKENGWVGRPLLLIERASDYVAWTGSHRIAAARKAGLRLVPCYVLDESELMAHGVDAEWGHVEDRERLEAIRKTKDEAAIQIMLMECQLC